MNKNRDFLKSVLLIFLTVSILLTGCVGNGNSAKQLEDGTYSVNVSLIGGTGKATINSPVNITVEDGKASATLIWSSKNYDYMIVDGQKYINEAEDGYSTFTIPVPNPLSEMTVIGDTTAMSVPHEVEYTINFEMNE